MDSVTLNVPSTVDPGHKGSERKRSGNETNEYYLDMLGRPSSSTSVETITVTLKIRLLRYRRTVGILRTTNNSFPFPLLHFTTHVIPSLGRKGSDGG